MKRFKILSDSGRIVGFIEAESIRIIKNGIDFQPNIFNSYHAIEFGTGDPPAVLNLASGMEVQTEEGV